MKVEELKKICQERHITFIPHHECAICGEYVGWYLFYRWPPFEVAFSSSCGCSPYSYAKRDEWESILNWITDQNGELREEYKWIKQDGQR